MISLVNIKTTNALGGFRVHLLADSTEDVEPGKSFRYLRNWICRTR